MSDLAVTFPYLPGPHVPSANPRPVRRDDVAAPEAASSRYGSTVVVGESAAMRHAVSRIDRVAPTGAAVLLHGEGGTGKKLLARALHERSGRGARPLTVVNCAAPGADVPARNRVGSDATLPLDAGVTSSWVHESRGGGTLLLEGVEGLSLEQQSHVLRVIDDGRGDCPDDPAALRVIATTRVNLLDAVGAGWFHGELYYRLHVVPIAVPTLRDRREDIPALAQHLVARLSRALRRQIEVIPTAVMRALEAHDWPGNVRELENVLHAAVILSSGPVLSLGDDWKPAPSALDPWTTFRLVDVERRHIRSILDATRWRIEGRAGAATLLGLKPSTLRSRMLKLGISRPEALTSAQQQPPAARSARGPA